MRRRWPTDTALAADSFVRPLSEERVAVSFDVIADGIAAWQNHPIDGFVFSEDALMRGITRALRSAGVTDDELCAVYALHHPAGECPGVWIP